MGHHHHHHSHRHHATGSLATAFWLNLSFSIIELIGGVFTNSVAIISDAIHDLGDAAAIGSAYYLEKLSGKQRDQHFSYGYKRFSSLSALLTSVILLVGSVWIVVEAIPRLLNPEPVMSEGMMGLALLGIAFNGIAVWRMDGGKGLNERAVRLHLIEDLLGWIAVMVGSILIYFFNWIIIDPILSMAIAVYIFYNSVSNLKEVATIFLQGVPDNINLKKIEEEIANFHEIQEVHDFHLWTMDGDYNVLKLHAVVAADSTVDQLRAIKKKVRTLVKENGIQHLTLEFESSNEDCELEDC